MDENIKKTINPYDRLKDVNEEIDLLAKREIQIKDMSQKEQKIYRKELDENESKQLFLFIEKEAYENAINWIKIYKKGFEDRDKIKELRGEK